MEKKKDIAAIIFLNVRNKRELDVSFASTIGWAFAKILRDLKKVLVDIAFCFIPDGKL